MKIREMKVTPIAIADAPLRNVVGIHEPYVNRIIVELVGEDGNSGFGEAAFSNRTWQDLLALRSDVIGHDSLNLNVLSNVVAARLGRPGALDLDPVLRNFELAPRRTNSAVPRTLSPIEVAALDLSGRSLGVPVCDLLGGRVRDAAPFS
ncbi:MAG TPA: hypothetical protein VFQ54_02360, partial [Thermomicrobiales bacterium]|nr:hypothetical protein [Thermomicrobiales bacterium]